MKEKIECALFIIALIALMCWALKLDYVDTYTVDVYNIKKSELMYIAPNRDFYSFNYIKDGKFLLDCTSDFEFVSGKSYAIIRETKVGNTTSTLYIGDDYGLSKDSKSN